MGALHMKNILRLLTAIALLLPAAAFAVDMYPPLVCNGLLGCGRPPENILLQNTLPTVAMFLIQLAAGGAVIAVVIGGVQMTVSGGDEGTVTNARKAILFALGGLGLAFAAAPIVSFVTTEQYYTGGEFFFGPGGILATAIRIIMTVFNVGFALVIIIAGSRMIVSSGSPDEFKKGGNMIKWAVIGGVIVNLARTGISAFLALNL